MIDWMTLSSLVLGLASALVAGVFMTFSDFVMAGLARAPAAAGIAAMQALNRTVYRSVFLSTFMAIVPLSVIFAAAAVLTIGGATAACAVAASAVYLATVFAVTAARNVPMNQRLDAMDADSQTAAAYWLTYSVSWTRWNHVRTIGATVTAALYLILVATP